MKELLTFVAKSLVDHPDQVVVRETEAEAIILELSVADVASPRDGRFIEEIGYYNPMTQPAEIKVDGERAKHWLQCGAQPTDTVRVLLKKTGVIEK